MKTPERSMWGALLHVTTGKPRLVKDDGLSPRERRDRLSPTVLEADNRLMLEHVVWLSGADWVLGRLSEAELNELETYYEACNPLSTPAPHEVLHHIEWERYKRGRCEDYERTHPNDVIETRVLPSGYFYHDFNMGDLVRARFGRRVPLHRHVELEHSSEKGCVLTSRAFVGQHRVTTIESKVVIEGSDVNLDLATAPFHEVVIACARLPEDVWASLQLFTEDEKLVLLAS